MSDFLGSAAEKSIKQSNDALPEAMENLSVISDNSDEKLSPKNLSDMPLDVVGMITEKSAYKEQLLLRKTSKSLRSLVDKQKPACKSISVFQYGEDIFINLTNYNVMYTAQANREDETVDGKVVKDDFEKIAFDDLASTLKHPKLQLAEIEVCCHIFADEKKVEEFYKNIQRVLESLNHQLSVKTCSMQVSNPSHLLSILPYLKPGVLKKISLMFDRNGFDWSIDSEEMDQVASLAQWKNAEELHLYDSFDRFPMKYATHFKRFNMFEYIGNSDKFVRIRNYFSKLDNFEHCYLTHESVFSSFDLTPFVGTLVVSSEGSKIYHYPIPDSEHYLEFTTSEDSICIEIEKKKRANSSF